MDVDVWVRGTNDAHTESMRGIPDEPSSWTDDDVRTLLTEMLLALERTRNPDGETPPVVLRGFSWIVSPHEQGVLVHLEMQMGTASAGPFAIDAEALTEMIGRVMAHPDYGASTTVH
ncbi:MAG: hypothetical protein R2712_07395 [Vicinamibacterales bacterium]